MTEERGDKGKVVASFTILGCKTDVIETPDGKRHFEGECVDKIAREKLASVFEQETILRINPKGRVGGLNKSGLGRQTE